MKSLSNKKTNKAPMIEARGRKSKIKPEFFHFIDSYFKDRNHYFISLKQLKSLLKEKFSLSEDDISLTIIFRMFKPLKIYYKKLVKFPC